MIMNISIGILDSGVGGLSIWKDLVKKLPGISTIYLADSFNCPYGSKSEDEVFALAKRLISFLSKQKIKIIVIACNTISVSSLIKLRRDFPNLILIGTIPAVKVASKLTKNGKIGILGTETTAKSLYVSDLIVKYANHHRVIVHGTDKLVPFVELGEIKNKRIQKIIETELKVFKKEEVDTLVLACTHFPFLKETISEKNNFRHIIDSSEGVVKRVIQVLGGIKQTPRELKPQHQLMTTGEVITFKNTVKILLGGKILSTIQIKKANI